MRPLFAALVELKKSNFLGVLTVQHSLPILMVMFLIVPVSLYALITDKW